MADPSGIVLQRSLYYGVWFMAMIFGLQVYMFGHSLSLYLRSSRPIRRKHRLYVVIGGLNVALTAIAITTDAVFMEFMWIDHADFPGGPLAFLGANSSIWWQTMGSLAGNLVNFLGDGLMIYRCYLVWQRSWKIIAFPILLYLGQIAMALLSLVQSAEPGSNFFQGATVNFGVPFVALSVALNIVLTVLIIYQIWIARRRLRALLSYDSLETYTGVTAILVESALPFTLLGIVAAILYGKNLEEAPAFVFIWATWAGLSPQFIIFRVTVGRSWTTDIASQMTMSNPVFALDTRPSSNGAATTTVNHSFTSRADSTGEMEFLKV